MKNVLRLLCALSLALTLTACGQPPAAPDVSSPAGDPVSSAEAGALPADFTWEAVSGGVRITEYHGDATHVVIPSILDNKKVVDLSSATFSGNVTIESVVLSAHMTLLNGKDFAGCDALTSITAPGAKKAEALKDLPALTSLILPAVQEFSAETVRDCPALRMLDLSGCRFVSKPYYANWPASLTEVILPDSLSYYEHAKFYLPNIDASLCTQDYAEANDNRAWQPVSDAAALYRLMFPETVTVVVGDERYSLGGQA